MRHRRGIIAACACALLAAFVASAVAAQPATSLGAAANQVKIGSNVRVTDSTGAQVNGKLLSLSDAGVSLDVEGTTRTIVAADVARIEDTGTLANGLLIGALVGAAVGGVTVAVAAGIDDDYSAGGLVGAFLLDTAIGAGVGLAIDAAKGPKTLYQAQRAARISVAPMLGARRKGVVLNVSF